MANSLAKLQRDVPPHKKMKPQKNQSVIQVKRSNSVFDMEGIMKNKRKRKRENNKSLELENLNTLSKVE